MTFFITPFHYTDCFSVRQIGYGGNKAAFQRQHESQLILYEAAAKALKEAGITKLPNLYALKTEYKKLDAERERLSAQYSEAKQKLKEYDIVKQNVDSILRTAPGKELTQER